MINKVTTSTGLILLGVSSFAYSSTYSSDIDNGLFQDPIVYQLAHYPLESEKSNVDMYVDSQYRMDENLANKYNLADYGFFHAVQNFAEEQVVLDDDFKSALDELFTSKIGAQPTKKRF